MNKEVKEILHLLKRCDNTYLKIENSNGEMEYEYHKVNDLRLDGYHSQLLLDYITNLQQENERLNTELKAYKDEFCKDTIKEYELVMEQEDYKSRCEKAIEYIDSKVLANGEVIDQLRKIEIEELLNILNGGDE